MAKDNSENGKDFVYTGSYTALSLILYSGICMQGPEIYPIGTSILKKKN
jgi:hypothetical protein